MSLARAERKFIAQGHRDVEGVFDEAVVVRIALYRICQRTARCDPIAQTRERGDFEAVAIRRRATDAEAPHGQPESASMRCPPQQSQLRECSNRKAALHVRASTDGEQLLA